MKRLTLIGVALLLALALTACGEEETAASTPSTKQTDTSQASSSEKDSVNLWKYYEDSQAEEGDSSTASEDETTDQKPTQPLNTNRHDEILAAWCAEDIVKQFLKAPSTAEVCPMDEMQISHLGNGEYMVTGWVDAQNSYGAMLRSDFVVTYTATKDGYENGYAIIG